MIPRFTSVRALWHNVAPSNVSLLLIALAGVLTAAASWYANRNLVTFQAQAPHAVSLQVFYSGDSAFSEAASRQVSTGSSGNVRLLLPLDATAYLRFDPEPGQRLAICGLRIDGHRASPLVAVANEVQAVGNRGCLDIAPVSGSQDPYVAIQTGIRGPQDATATRIRSIAARIGVAVAALALLLLVFGTTREFQRLTPLANRFFEGATLRAHWIALALMITFGSVFAHLLPPNGVPDEVAHISKIAKMEAGAWLGDTEGQPTVRVLDMYGPFHNIVQGPPFTPEQLRAQQQAPLGCDRKTSDLPSQADHYAPHLYAVPAVAMTAACATGASFGSYLATARILNLLLAAALMALGIRFASHGKWSLFVVALLPMTLVQVASITADSLTLALSFCFIGLVSGIASGTLSPARTRWILPLLAVGLAFAKPGAAWILLSIVFCRNAYAAHGASFRWGLVSILIIPWLLHLGWTLLSAGDARPLDGVDPIANMQVLKHDPLAVAAVMANTLLGGSGEFLFRSTVGLLGWLDVPLSSNAYWLAAAALIASLLVNPNSTRIPVLVRCVAIAAALGSMALTALPLYLYWTYADSPTVMGLQGRYFLPALAFALVWSAGRAPAITRAVLLSGLILAMPVLAIDARNQIDTHYYAGKM